jgi:hypothetical protein
MVLHVFVMQLCNVFIIELSLNELLYKLDKRNDLNKLVN